MADDFSFNCPRCGKEPKRGIFLGSEIWHTDCIIEDLIEKFKNGTPREEIEKTLKRVKNKDVEQKVGLDCGWPEYQPQKTPEELEAEYQAELEAAAAAQEAEEAKKAAEEAAQSGDEEATAAAAKAAEDAANAANAASKKADDAKIQTTPATTQAAPGVSTPSPIPQQQAVATSQYMAPPAMAPAMMPQMALPSIPSSGNALKPSPKDPTVRRIALSAMEVCLKNMRKDVEYGKLLLKFIKDIYWDKDEKDEDEDEELEESEETDDEENPNPKGKKGKPFLVEN